MKAETIEKILNFLETNEDKQIPSKWFNSIIKFIEKLENHPDAIQYKHEGDLELSHTNITKLPNDLYVDGYLNLINCKKITKLPDNLYVGGKLYLNETNITELPDNLYVGGYLALYGCTKITKLPDNLYVVEDLDLSGTNITELPDNLYFGWNLYIKNTPLAKKYTDQEIRDIVASTGNKIRGSIIR